jgi:uncharacterized protein (TIGR02246 family)
MPVDPAAVRDMAARYAMAWSSRSPEAVASFYEPDGRIVINRGEPIVGRVAITAMAQGFYDEFPDLVVHCDGVRTSGNDAIFLWTLEGHNSGPGGSGHFVRLGGWEAWRLSDRVLVAESAGSFDAEDYQHQRAEGYRGE